jgi:hypothetical protein
MTQKYQLNRKKVNLKNSKIQFHLIFKAKK